MRTRILITWAVIAATLATVITIARFGGSDADSVTAESAPVTEPVAPPASEPIPIPIIDETNPAASPAEPVVVVAVEEPVGEPDLPPPDDPPTPSHVDFVVDVGLTPDVATIEPLAGSDQPRPIARLRSTGGTDSEIVLDELSVAFTSDDDRDAFLERWNGVVLDAEIDEDAGITDYLVRIDPSTAPRAELAANIVAVEPHHRGTMAASHDDAFALLAIAGYEIVHHGTEVALNWLFDNNSVRTGSTTEDSALSDSNAMNFPWISSTAAQATGIDAAWQLIAGYGGVGNRIKMMVVDRGFVYNADFPSEAELHHGDWGGDNSSICSSGNPCPFHGTSVTMAAMGQFDNDFGTAGPASQVGELTAVRRASDMNQTFKEIKKLAKTERPHVINMSFGGNVTAFQGTLENKFDRWFRKVRDDYDALPFAAAGNDGVDVDNNDALSVPCEIPSVVCVGGLNGDDGLRANGSNFGTKTGGGSVEIYGPMCTYGLQNPDVPGDGTTRDACGTSLATPVVAGVAAMVRAANPTLDAKQTWQVMKDTAHTENLGSEIGDGHHRSIDAYRAVATAMGRSYTAPVVEITTDAGDIGPTDFFDLSARATNFANLDLAVQWVRGDGSVVNSTPTTEPIALGELAPGTHVFRAWAWDVMGNAGHDTIEIEVSNTPPQVSISSPAANTYRYTVEQVVLDGSTRDADLLWQSLADDEVTWSVRSLETGDVVLTRQGHASSIPPHSLEPGDYSVEFAGVDEGGIVITDSALLTMLDVPPGESLPNVVMHAPLPGDGYATDDTVGVRLHASANDVQDGTIDGTRMRWIAEQGDTRIVLCEGSDLAEGSGGVAMVNDCSDVTVPLGIPPEAPHNNRWTITVEAIDSAGLPGRVTRVVEIHASVG